MSLLNTQTAAELADRIRRLLGDTSDNPVVQQSTLREMVIAQYILSQHELGWNPVIPERPVTAASLLSYALNAGDYQTTQETDADVVASGEVWNDRMLRPMEFRAREVLEGWINRDIKNVGAPVRGIPLYWTMRVDWVNTPPDTLEHRMLVYPACDQATTIYWPRTLVETASVDPTQSGKMPLSYQAMLALESKIASMLVAGMSADGLAQLRIDRSFATVLWQQWVVSSGLERAERAMHTLQDYVIQKTA